MIVGGFFDFWRKNEFRKFILERGRAKTNEETQTDQTDQSDLIKSLTVEQLQSAFYFFVLGISASSITLMIEYKIKPKKRFKRVVQTMIMTRRLMESHRQSQSQSQSQTHLLTNLEVNRMNL